MNDFAAIKIKLSRKFKIILPGHLRKWFFLAVAVKFGLLAFLIFFVWGKHGFPVEGVFIPGHIPSWINDYFFFLEPLCDFKWRYRYWYELWWAGVPPYSIQFDYGNMPFPISPEYQRHSMIYPPLFPVLAFLIPGTMFSAPIMLVLFDCLTGLLVYRMAHTVLGRSEQQATRIMFCYMFNPLVLFQIDYMWQHSIFHTFFLVMALLLEAEADNHTKKRYHDWSAVAFGLAVMSKQFAGMVLPIFLLWRFRDGGKAVVRWVGLWAAICLGISLPFLLINTDNYLHWVFFQNNFYWSSWPPATILDRWNQNVFTNLPKSLWMSFYGLKLPYTLVWMLMWLQDHFILFGLVVLYTLGVAITYFYGSLWQFGRTLRATFKPRATKASLDLPIRTSKSWVAGVFFLTFLLIWGIHTTYASGVYKLYLVFLTPFIQLFTSKKALVNPEKAEFTKKDWIIALGVPFVLLFSPLYFTPLIMVCGLIFYWVSRWKYSKNHPTTK